MIKTYTLLERDGVNEEDLHTYNENEEEKHINKLTTYRHSYV